jgi:hypothetical protein
MATNCSCEGVCPACRDRAGVVAYRAQREAVRAEEQAVTERDNATRSFKLPAIERCSGHTREMVRMILESAGATFDTLAARRLMISTYNQPIGAGRVRGYLVDARRSGPRP